MMRMMEIGHPIPEVDDLEQNEVLNLRKENKYLAIMSIRKSLVFVESNDPNFDKIWIYTGSLLFQKNSEKYREANCFKPADRHLENIYFKTSNYYYPNSWSYP